MLLKIKFASSFQEEITTMKNIIISLTTALIFAGSFHSCKAKMGDGRTKNVDAINKDGKGSIFRNNTCDAKTNFQSIFNESHVNLSLIGLDKITNDQINDLRKEALKLIQLAPPVIAQTAVAAATIKNDNVVQVTNSTLIIEITAEKYKSEACRGGVSNAASSSSSDASQAQKTTTNLSYSSADTAPGACFVVENGVHFIRIFTDGLKETADQDQIKAKFETLKLLLNNYLLVEMAFIYDSYMSAITPVAIGEMPKDQFQKQLNDYKALKQAIFDAVNASKEQTPISPIDEKIKSLYFAEAIDSYYCSDITRADLTKTYKNAADAIKSNALLNPGVLQNAGK
jgi:hypothetical protein